MAYESAQNVTTFDDKLIHRAGSFQAVDRVNAGSALTLFSNIHAGKTILLNAAAGSTVTLPAATGTNDEYTFVVSTVATSNNHIIRVANASDIMVGVIETLDSTTGALAPFGTASTSDTITLNRSTTGSVRTGETITLKDVALNRWNVCGSVVITGTAATPFSATV